MWTVKGLTNVVICTQKCDTKIIFNQNSKSCLWGTECSSAGQWISASLKILDSVIYFTTAGTISILKLVICIIFSSSFSEWTLCSTLLLSFPLFLLVHLMVWPAMVRKRTLFWCQLLYLSKTGRQRSVTNHRFWKDRHIWQLELFYMNS